MADTPNSTGQGATAISRKDLEAKIVANAWRDPNYQARLLSDPKAVLQEELSAIDPSITLPDSLQVFVHSEGADTYHLVEPRNPSEVASPDATDDQLAGVAPQTVAVVVGTNPSMVVIDGYIVTGPSNMVSMILVSGVAQTVVGSIQVVGTGPVVAANITAVASITNVATIA